MTTEGGRDFIVVASPLRYRNILEENKKLKLLALFGESSGYKGDEVKISEVLP